jgi:hypothetical protein
MPVQIDCPAEVVMERQSRLNNFRWTWAVCQPDCHWGVWKEGTSEDKRKAERDAYDSLSFILRKQGYSNGYNN